MTGMQFGVPRCSTPWHAPVSNSFSTVDVSTFRADRLTVVGRNRKEVMNMGTNEQIRNLQAMRDTAANAQGQIDTQIQNLRNNQMDEAQRNLGYLAVHNTLPPPG